LVRECGAPRGGAQSIESGPEGNDARSATKPRSGVAVEDRQPFRPCELNLYYSFVNCSTMKRKHGHVALDYYSRRAAVPSLPALPVYRLSISRYVKKSSLLNVSVVVRWYWEVSALSHPQHKYQSVWFLQGTTIAIFRFRDWRVPGEGQRDSHNRWPNIP